MFHDRSLNAAATLHNHVAAAFELNAFAVKLSLLVEHYKMNGQRVLPCSYLKRAFFTRRQWELATKGRREYDGRRLVDKAPAKDGCEALGIVSEHTEIDEETGTPRTYWIVGQVDTEALEEIKRDRQERAFSVIDEEKPSVPEDGEKVEPSVRVGTETAEEAAYDRGYREGEASGYAKGEADASARVHDLYEGGSDIERKLIAERIAPAGYVVTAADHVRVMLAAVERLSSLELEQKAASEVGLGF